MLKIDFGDCPVEKTYFGGTVNFSDKQIRFLFHYPECLVDEKYIANNQYAKDIYGLFGKFRDLEECPSLEEAYFLLFSHILISRSEVPYFYLEFVDSKKEVLEEVCIRDGKFEKITAMTEFGKISVSNFGNTWSFIEKNGLSGYCDSRNGIAKVSIARKNFSHLSVMPQGSLEEYALQAELQMEKKLTRVLDR